LHALSCQPACERGRYRQTVPAAMQSLWAPRHQAGGVQESHMAAMQKIRAVMLT